MTDPKETGKIEVPTRTPRKKTQGIFDNLRKIPERHPVEEILGLPQEAEASIPTPSTPSSPPTISSPSTGSTGATPSIGSALVVRTKTSVSPRRDYMKVANSITKQAIPSGVFGEQGGKSKELYDALYSLTRGAVVPRRKIRIPKDRLMRLAGIGSEVTLKKNMQRLRGARLIKESIVAGMHGGNEYEVFLPEEVGLETGSTPSTPSTPATGSSSPQMREGVDPLASRDSSPSVIGETTTTSRDDKTLILRPGLRDDDEAFALFLREMKKAIFDVTGRQVSTSESAKLLELAEVLTTELRIAAARTTVSSAPAFLTEHLRRRLWKKDKQQLSEEIKISANEPAALSLDISKCPDCGGSGFYYPKGYEEGVAKCKHEKLTKLAKNDS